MEIVIKISDKLYKFVKNVNFVENESTLFKQTSAERQKTLFLFDILDAIKNGTPIPEQRPFEDCISRAEVLKAIEEEKQDWGNAGVEAIDGCLEAVGNLPSVTPRAESEEMCNMTCKEMNEMAKAFYDGLIEGMESEETSELDKLEEYLKKYNIPYERIDEEGIFNRHQILVKDEDGVVIWDAICHIGSYGYEKGLLEIMGTLVRPEDRDSVAGWLTAEDVIKRIENR